ncbi:hypothetical protein M0R45_020801 [Rubus argutus]|uniref:DNA topoisomerase n=1 Tax=Rubus argutus TaxID=59490 RepID=A0AAW1XCM3_RUBAR
MECRREDGCEGRGLETEEKYKWAIVDGVKKEVTNFRIIPPGLFKGRGKQHPKSGKLMRRICPKDVTINIGKDALIPECSIPGESWKEIRHDNTVTWLAFYNHPINQKEFRYVFLAGPPWQREKGKYEKARLLKDYIGHIRAAYTWDFTSEDSEKRQLAVATYLMDKLGLRAGTEKVHDDDDEADVVGCRRLKVENVKPISPNLLEFSFLGKDLIRYENTVEVDLPVYEAIIQFQAGKCGSDELFDKLDSHKLNAHLKELMPGLTAKVFHTYNASITLDNIVDMICSHQIDITESHSAQMSRLTEKIGELQDILTELKKYLDGVEEGESPSSPRCPNGKRKRDLSREELERKMAQTTNRIASIKRAIFCQKEDIVEMLGLPTSEIIDPRITVAWCRRHEVPIEKIFPKSLLRKFAWAMEVSPDFRF